MVGQRAWLALGSAAALLGILLAGCGGTPEPTAEPTQVPATPAAVALRITGQVEQEMSWTEAQVRAMKTVKAQSTNSQGQAETYTGVPIRDLLALAGVKEGAATLVFVGPGAAAEVPLADIQACADCILSFRSKGGFSTVLPGFSSKLQVKGVSEIQVK